MDKQEKIRDHMDDILEAKDFYRKHVARGPDSIFRSVADVVFATQRYKDVVKDAALKFKESEEGFQLFDESNPAAHKEARALAKIFDLSIEIVSTTDPLMRAFIITPEDAYFAPFSKQAKNDSEDEESSASSFDSAFFNVRDRLLSLDNGDWTRVLLCYTEPYQYDPIFHMSMIESAALSQSILYEILYEKVFCQEGAYEASKIMLSDDPFKPTVYDKEFDGKPMEAIENNLIPFPYKVAKAMDPSTYRNIEYDVWTSERKAMSPPPKKTVSPRPTSISSLPRGTPCLVQVSADCTLPGFVQGPIASGTMMEVFIPLQDSCIYVKRKDILPIKNPSEEFDYLRRSPKEKSRKFPPSTNVQDYTVNEPRSELEIFESQLRNHSLTMYDKDWVNKFDFTIPPPNQTVTSVPSTPVRTTFQPPCSTPSYYSSDVFIFPAAQPESNPRISCVGSCTVPGCLGISPVPLAVDAHHQVHVVSQDNNNNSSMMTNNIATNQDSTHHGVVGPAPNVQLTYPVATAFPNQPNSTPDGSVFWVPFVVSSPSPWSQSVVPPGTPFSPGLIQGSNYFRFDGTCSTEIQTPGPNQVQAQNAPYLGTGLPLFAYPVPQQQHQGTPLPGPGCQM